MAGVLPENIPQRRGLADLDLEEALDIEPAMPVSPEGAPSISPTYTSPLLTTDLASLLQYVIRLLQKIDVDLSPDNYQVQLKYLTNQTSAGTQYDFPIPSWVRKWLLTNRSAGSGSAGNLYYFFNSPAAGNKTLPQNYRTLTAGQSVSESSNYDAPISGYSPVLSVFPDATCTDQGWELAFIGWYGILYNPLPSL
jgi:hypothetical protein